MDLNTSLTLTGALLGGVAVWYARRGAVAAEEAVRVARLPLDREELEKTLTPLERAILRAALDAPKGVIFLHRHFEDRGPHVVLGLTHHQGVMSYPNVPSHEPIPDPTASAERLVTIGYLESAASRPMDMGMTTNPQTISSMHFEQLRITPAGRSAATTIERSAPEDFISKAGLQTFRTRC